jgi:hypothetical protein
MFFAKGFPFFYSFTAGTILNGTKKPKNKNTPPR